MNSSNLHNIDTYIVDDKIILEVLDGLKTLDMETLSRFYLESMAALDILDSGEAGEKSVGTKKLAPTEKQVVFLLLVNCFLSIDWCIHFVSSIKGVFTFVITIFLTYLQLSPRRLRSLVLRTEAGVGSHPRTRLQPSAREWNSMSNIWKSTCIKQLILLWLWAMTRPWTLYRWPWPHRSNYIRRDQEIGCGSLVWSEFQGEKIPTLAEVMDLVDGKHKLWIELKAGGDYPGIEWIVDLIHAKQAEEWAQVISFDTEALRNIHHLDSEIVVHQLLVSNLTLLPWYLGTKLYREIQRKSTSWMVWFTTIVLCANRWSNVSMRGENPWWFWPSTVPSAWKSWHTKESTASRRITQRWCAIRSNPIPNFIHFLGTKKSRIPNSGILLGMEMQ